MPKSFAAMLALGALVGAGAAAQAASVGPHADACAAGRGPALLVRVEGLKSRSGTVRVQTYGGDPEHYFDKGSYLSRVDVRPPATGPVEVCMPVPKPGTYAVSVRHDVDGSHKSSLKDGGGMSGNPNVSLMDVVFKRRPSPEEVAVEVRGVKRIAIVMNYVHGTSVGPIAGLER